MSLETILIMGISMGRTIVLPPEHRIYLFNNKEKKQHFKFQDFLHLKEAEYEHSHVKFMSMDEYLEKVALKGLLVNQTTGIVKFPPNNRTNWNQAYGTTQLQLWQYIRNTSMVDDNCIPMQSISYFPANTTDFGPESQFRVMSLIQNASKVSRSAKFKTNPMPANASEVDRLNAHLLRRNSVCFYNNQMQNALSIHYKFSWKGTRFLLPFYSFHFFENYKQELWSKRFVRDHLRYNDEFMCAAARIVAALREDARSLNPDNQDGLFHAMHIRHGDFLFQYKQTFLNADKIYEKSIKFLQMEDHVSKVLYIATDEKNKTFFKPLQSAYHTVFLSDYLHLVEGINANYYALIEQLILARSDIFIGTHYSTFTSYVNRLRGYYSWRDKSPGYDRGIIKSYYFTQAEEIHQQYFSLKNPDWAYEFPESWLNIDEDVEFK